MVSVGVILKLETVLWEYCGVMINLSTKKEAIGSAVRCEVDAIRNRRKRKPPARVGKLTNWEIFRFRGFGVLVF